MELGEYLRIISRRKWLIIFAIIVTTITAVVASSRQKPVYQASVTIGVPAASRITLLDEYIPSDAYSKRVIETQILRVKSYPIVESVIEELKLDMTPGGLLERVSVKTNPAAQAFELKVIDTDPKRVAEIANKFAQVCIDKDEVKSRAEVEETLGRVEKKLKEREQEIASLGKQIDDIRFQQASPSFQSAPVSMEVFAEWTRLTNSYGQLAAKADEIALVKKSRESALEIIQPAIPPAAPFKPNPAEDGLIGLVGGLILGVGSAFVLEYLDNTLKTDEDIEKYFKSTTLGNIPDTLHGGKEEYQIISDLQPSSIYAEAYRTLRTAIHYLNYDKKIKSILLANALSRDGKPTALANLATTFAQAGSKVVVICSDLRNPKLHHFFKVENERGLTDLLVGDLEIEEVLADTNVEGVKIISSGPVPPNPAELLGSPRMGDLITVLKDHADIVLLDSAPIVAVTDAAVLAQKVDGVIIVAAAGQVTRELATKARSLFDKVKAPLLGIVVLNRAK